MGGQGIERREILRILAAAAAAAQFPGFCKWSFACGHVGNATTQIRPAAYRPLFFTAPEYTLIDCLTDIIIPHDASLGAREAGVSEFIDLMVSRDPGLQGEFRGGLNWLETRSRTAHAEPFLRLTAEQRVALLEPLAYKAKFRKGEERGREFFDLLREYTVMGFYTSEIGLQQLDFPGFKFYAESPACPHLDDPEHLHLSPPQW